MSHLVWFHTGKISSEPKSIQHFYSSQIMLFFAGGEMNVCFLPGYVLLFKMVERNLHLLTTAVVICTILRAKDNGAKWLLQKHFEASSHEQCVASRHAEEMSRPRSARRETGARMEHAPWHPNLHPKTREVRLIWRAFSAGGSVTCHVAGQVNKSVNILLVPRWISPVTEIASALLTHHNITSICTL